jgi:hypothetical protein
MNVATGESPGDSVAGVDPNLVGKKGNSLFSHVFALTGDCRAPILLRPGDLRQTQDHQHKQ